MAKGTGAARIGAALIRADAVIRALDDVLAAREEAIAQPVLPLARTRPSSPEEAERLAGALAELRDEADSLAAELREAEREAVLWEERARQSDAQGRANLARQAEVRREEWNAVAAGLATEMARMVALLAQGELLCSQPPEEPDRS